MQLFRSFVPFSWVLSNKFRPLCCICSTVYSLATFVNSAFLYGSLANAEL